MKSLISGMFVAGLALAVGCGKKEGDGGGAGEAAKPEAERPAEPEKPIELTATVDIGAAITDEDVTGYAGLEVKAPEGTTAEEGLVGVQVKYGSVSYEISKAFEPGYVAKAKGEANEDQLDKLVAFHVDTPEAILWESKSELGGDNNFHFAAEVAVGDDKFKCGNKGWGSFTRAQAEALLKSCQSLSR